MNDRKKQVYVLQKHLCSIRKIAGWTTEELGYKIGVSKQTISNLENQKTPMSVTQYIAIRTILDYEIKNNNSNESLKRIVEILLDSEYDFDNEDEVKLTENINVIAAAASGGISGAALFAVASTLLPSIVQGVIVGSSWISKILVNKKK